MRIDLLGILNDRIDRLNCHGRFEECAVVERSERLALPAREVPEK